MCLVDAEGSTAAYQDLRLEFEGAFWHITSRGNRRKTSSGTMATASGWWKVQKWLAGGAESVRSSLSVESVAFSNN